jgi:Protein of unknown function (DUF2530)
LFLRVAKHGGLSFWVSLGLGLSSMNAEPPEPGQQKPPALPSILLEPWPVIIVIAVGWLIAVILAFTVTGLHEWRPVAVAGLGVGVLGTSIFLWQRNAVRRGSRGAQSGLR